MRELILLAVVAVAAIVLLVLTRAIERQSRRPGIAMRIAAGVMLVGSVASAKNSDWWLAGIFVAQGLIFMYEASRRRRDAASEANAGSDE